MNVQPNNYIQATPGLGLLFVPAQVPGAPEKV